jgi:hypothetical protein
VPAGLRAPVTAPLDDHRERAQGKHEQRDQGCYRKARGREQQHDRPQHAEAEIDPRHPLAPARKTAPRAQLGHLTLLRSSPPGTRRGLSR